MISIEDKALAFLESCVRDYRIFIDTCSILSEQANLFWSNIVPILQREGKTIVVPKRVCEEIEKFANDPALCAQKKDPALNQRAKAAINNIALMKRAGIVEIFGDDSDNFADNVFQTVFTQFRLKYNLLLITQDHNLASDIDAIGKSKAVNTQNRILVERINKYGYLSLFGDQKTPKNPHNNPVHVSHEHSRILDDECFAFATKVRQIDGNLPLTSVPTEGAALTATRNEGKKPVRLAEAISSGGEGTIYSIDIPGIVAKIYKPEKLNRAKFEKLNLMLTKNIYCEGVCFPLALLFNQQNEFVGYLMKQARGKELQRCVFIPQLLKKTFPNWTKIDTVTLCITILKKLKYLHERNIILGDINPNNILIVSPTEVYFVDTDSYQVEGFPCPVGTINYTAPEIQRKDFSSFLRTLGNERFAVATLLFMIMLPGKPPYSLQGGENQIDNIINGDFAYASGSRSNGKAPEGVWRFCWSHLPRYLKDDFYETFCKGGEHSTENTRYSTGDWLKKFENYLELLNNGKMAEQDSMSLDIFPSRLKKNPQATYISCKICGEDVEEDRTEQGICRDCLKKGETYHCARCRCEMIYTNYQKYIKRSAKHEICKDCYNRENMVYKTICCSECGRTFEITNREKEFYDSKGFQLPKKCKDCRGHKTYNDHAKSQSEIGQSYNTQQRSYNSWTSSKSSSKSSWCFITTAACEHFGKSDDCYELTMLRRFRDGWLALQPSGVETIKEYYRIAPSIVKALNSSEECNALYADIWNRCILPCVRFIEQGAYEKCRTLYEKMVIDLKNLYYKEK